MRLRGSIRLRLSLAVAAAAAVFLSLGVWFTLDRVEASATASVREVEERTLDELVALNEALVPVPPEPIEVIDGYAEISAALQVLADLELAGKYEDVAELFGLDSDQIILAASDGTLVEVDVATGAALPAGPEALLPGAESRILPTYELFDIAEFSLLGDDPVEFDEFGVVEVPLSGSAVVVGAQGLDEVEASIAALRGPLWLGAALLTLLTGLVAWVLTGRALRPVATMAHRVAEISGGSLHERIPEPDSSDEIAELALTMNGMLDRLESSDQRRRRFVSDASHELRSPVATIRSVTEVAARRPDQADWPDVADDVLAETQRLEDLVADLLQLARADEGQVAKGGGEVDLDDLVLAEIKRTRRVSIDGAAVGAVRVWGRADELQRMVRHLVDNATRHAASQVRVELSTDGPQARLIVDDDGPGIAPADRELVFERFVRLDQARSRDQGGAGLGLAVAAAVASAHRGTVTVDESSMGGARFTVALPLLGRR